MSGQAVITIKNRQWQAYLATTYAELTAGLKGAAALPAATGMLFVLPQDQAVTVTMQGVLFPLDIVFISSPLQVVDVALGVAPGMMLNEDTPVGYFLEVNAGEAEGIEAGDAVSISVIQGAETPDWTAPVVSFTGVMMVGTMMVNMGRVMADAVFGKPKAKPLLYGPRGERLLPQTANKPARQDVEIGTWAERDRTGIWLTDKRTDKTIAEWWDEDAREMFEQGWFKRGDIRQQTITGQAFKESVLDYAESVGLLDGGKYLAQTIKDACYWTAINKDTGEIAESHTPYTGSGRALRSGKAFVSRHWQSSGALVEVWRQPCRHSEKLNIHPVASEILTPERKKAGEKPAYTGPRYPQSGKEDMEFLPDSPEFLAYTIDDIGYREKMDGAFLQAIARARGKRR